MIIQLTESLIREFPTHDDIDRLYELYKPSLNADMLREMPEAIYLGQWLLAYYALYFQVPDEFNNIRNFLAMHVILAIDDYRKKLEEGESGKLSNSSS